MADTGAGIPKHTNRLAKETSPYLLQHAHNPVDWYAWGPDAFAAARREDKPIFLSVGYSTCYWCHVMERQSFVTEQHAREMNQRFINIKVDREERPDVDQLYMTAVQVLTHQGGWPMSVFLRPDLRPFYGGTYFPPTDMHGRAGFLTVLRAIEDAYRNRAGEVEQTATRLTEILQQLAEPRPPEKPITLNQEFIAELVERSTDDYDPQSGGFGAAPKFPRQTLLEMLLLYLREIPDAVVSQSKIENRKSKILTMVLRTLDAMAAGGIHDHLGGGFHRYSTDAQWLVPHFEIMLYDNAMLAWVYVEAHRQTKKPAHAKVARGILDFVLREMTSPQGAFYTAFDAEVDAMEGASYLWTGDEIDNVLGADDAMFFKSVYGVDRGPNFADPHQASGAPDKNILYLREPLTAVASRLGIGAEDLDAKLAPMRRSLYEARRKRKQPLLDTKIITSWNALMIRAMAYAGRILEEDRYLRAAVRAADFLMQQHRGADGALWRTSRDGHAKHDAFLDDYAFLAQALIELSRVDGQAHRKGQAAAVAEAMSHRFGDAERGGFYFSAQGAADLIVRQKMASDSPLPSGNAVAAMALLELGQVDAAQRTIAAFVGQLVQHGAGMSAMVEAAIIYLRAGEAFTIEPGEARGPRPASPQDAAASVVSLLASWQSPTELHVHMGIQEGYHVNANRPAKGLIATQLAVTGETAGDVERADYPPGTQRQFPFADEPMSVYDESVSIAVHFKRPMTNAPRVRMVLSYQACDDSSCLPPMTKQFEVDTP